MDGEPPESHRCRLVWNFTLDCNVERLDYCIVVEDCLLQCTASRSGRFGLKAEKWMQLIHAMVTGSIMMTIERMTLGI